MVIVVGNEWVIGKFKKLEGKTELYGIFFLCMVVGVFRSVERVEGC